MVAQCEAAQPWRRCRVADFYAGAEVQLIASVELQDVRLVYAPPSAVGNYGGEVDSWMWPRHTGVFALLRAWVGERGAPAEYAEHNVPYQPARWLEVAIADGVDDGDFVAVLGFPGSTQRYQSAAEVQRHVVQVFPARIDLYGEWIAIREAAGARDAAVRIKWPTNPGIHPIGFFAAFDIFHSQPAATLETPHTADGSFSLELLAPAFQVQFESDGWISLQAEGFQSAGKPGEPALPRHHLQLALPPQADPASVWMEISNLKVERLPGTYHVRTIPPDSPGNTGTSGTTSSWTGESANASTFARLLSTGQMRKWRFANLEHAPFAYEPASGQLSLASRMLITIHYRLDPSATETVLLSDDLMDDLAKARFNNYEQAQVWYPPVEAPEQLEAAYDYVIVTTNAIQSGSSNLDDFILHKQALGYSVLTITESVYEELAGQSHNGTAEKIRQWLKENYLTFGIKFVMLVGDPDPDDPSLEDTVGDVPMMMAWPRRSANDSYQNSPTDYFFADLTGDWDKDGDGYFGEWVEDQGTGGVDFAPEVHVGRIPVYSGDIATLDAVLQMIMDYENEDSPLSWRKQALLPMRFLAVGYDGAPLAEQMKADFLDAVRQEGLRRGARVLRQGLRQGARVADRRTMVGNSPPSWA